MSAPLVKCSKCENLVSKQYDGKSIHLCISCYKTNRINNCVKCSKCSNRMKRNTKTGFCGSCYSHSDLMKEKHKIINFFPNGHPMKGKVGANKGVKMSKEWREKLSKSHKTIENIEKSIKNISKNFGIKGENHPSWIKDRTLINTRIKAGFYYEKWRAEVYKRDNWKCKIANSSCCGKIEAHHILPWRNHVELRFNINNGITLCHFHHPRKWEEEKRLAPVFFELVSVSKETIAIS